MNRKKKVNKNNKKRSQSINFVECGRISEWKVDNVVKGDDDDDKNKEGTTGGLEVLKREKSIIIIKVNNDH